MRDMIFEDSLHPTKVVNGKEVIDYDKVLVISKMIKNYLDSESTNIIF